VSQSITLVSSFAQNNEAWLEDSEQRRQDRHSKHQFPYNIFPISSRRDWCMLQNENCLCAFPLHLLISIEYDHTSGGHWITLHLRRFQQERMLRLKWISTCQRIIHPTYCTLFLESRSSSNLLVTSSLHFPTFWLSVLKNHREMYEVESVLLNPHR